MKTVVLMRARAGAAPMMLPDLLAGRPWAARASRIVVQLGIGAAPPPIYDAVAEIWAEAPVVAAIAGDPVLAAGWTLDVRISREVVGKPAATTAAGTTPGLAQLSFIRAIPGMPRAETERHWDEHIPLACAVHVGMNRYVQDRLSAGAEGTEPWFGMAHLHFPDEAALHDGLFRGPEDIAAISADVAEFVAGHATMLAVEHVVKG